MSSLGLREGNRVYIFEFRVRGKVGDYGGPYVGT